MAGDGKRIVKYRGVWCLYWREAGKSKRRVLSSESREQAERRWLDIQEALRKQKPLKTIGEIIEAYFVDKTERGKDMSRPRYNWRPCKETWDHLEPRHVTRKACQDFITARRELGASDGTIRKQLGILAAALRWHDPNTPAVIELPPQPRPRNRFLSFEEANRLVDACVSPHIRLFVILALTTAARTGALLDLTWDRVDFDRGRIYLGSNKGNKGRAVVPMNDDCRFELVAARDAALTDYVIEYQGKPVSSIKKGFASACRRAGLTDVSPHDLRHTAAVWMAEAGIPMSEISQYLGHSSTAVTEKVYARYSPDYLGKAAKALNFRQVQKNLLTSSRKMLSD